MNQTLIEKLKNKLEEEKKSLQKELENFATKDKKLKDNWDTKYPNREDGDKDEEADEIQEYDNSLSLEYSLESRLKDINNALEKIEHPKDDSIYGVCENCGEQISEERLLVYPEAKTCLKCGKKK